MKRLNYLDGLKGWCAVSVCIFHFLLMFVISGFIGWKCLPEAALNPFEYYFKWFPYSILTNNSFPLYIFFALTSFIVSYTFLKNRNEDKLKQKIVMRYFRLMPLVLIACIIAYLLLEFKLCPLQEFYDITGNTWGLAMIENDFTFFEALEIGLFTTYFERTHLVSPFWCMFYIFLGSMLSFIMMLLYTKVDNKIFFFGSAILMFWFVDQNYLAFIIGLIAGIIANKEYSMSKTTGALLVVLGCILGLFPPVLLPSFINVVTLYALGAGFVIVGIHCCFSNHRLLCNKFAEFLGKESLALIVWQFLIMQSLNIFLYNYFYSTGMNDPMNIAINFVVNAGLSLFFTWVSAKTITPLTNYVCNRMRVLLWKNTFETGRIA